MLVDILEIDKFVKEMALTPVDNPINFNSDNTPTEDGLFSIQIFGQLGSNARKTNWSYINLNKKFLHPLMYKMLKDMNRNIEKCILGQGRYIINDNGELIEDENGEMGITFIYNNFDKIVFKNTGSNRRIERLNLMDKLKKDDLFIDKWLLIPAYYRDYKTPKKEGDRIDAIDEINNNYSKLIRLASVMSDDEGFAFTGVSSEATMQTTLNEIYRYLTSALAKKTGIIHQGLLGKSVDYATRSVISAPRLMTQKWDENSIKFGYTGVPLSQVCVLFYPFFVKFIQDMVEPFKEELEAQDINVDEQFSEEKIKKMLELFIKSPDSRFQPFKVYNKKGDSVPVNLYYEDLHRPFSLTDLIYIASYDIIQDKHVFITRYPIEQYQNIYPSKITLLSTKDTVMQKIHDRILPNYPVIYPDYPGKLAHEEVWVDTVRPYNGYLASLGGDYDGDTVSLRAVFTHEANREADNIINSKANILDQTGSNARKIGNEAIQAIFGLTRKI